MPHYLFFEASTKQQEAQCRYFLLKYLALHNLKPPADVWVVLATNNPVAFEGFTSFFPHFQMPALIDGASKAEALFQFLQQHNGSVVWCDPATYPTQPLQHLFADIEKGTVYLHSPHRYTEAALNPMARWRTALRLAGSKPATTVQTQTTVWDTAVIGISSQQKGLVEPLIPEATKATNTLALDTVFTKTFSAAGKIKPASKYIFSYAGFAEFDQLLEAFFKKTEEESIPNQIKALHHVDAAAIQQQKEQYSQQPLLKKWLQIVSGKRWSIRKWESRW